MDNFIFKKSAVPARSESRAGKLLARFRIANARNFDWESLAIDDAGHPYIADVGNKPVRTDFSAFLTTRLARAIAHFGRLNEDRLAQSGWL
jgi:hypothetical protein